MDPPDDRTYGVQSIIGMANLSYDLERKHWSISHDEYESFDAQLEMMRTAASCPMEAVSPTRAQSRDAGQASRRRHGQQAAAVGSDAEGYESVAGVSRSGRNTRRPVVRRGQNR